MNFAFSALIIIIFLLPGVILLENYYRGDWSTSLAGRSFSDKILGGLIASIIIHFIFYIIFYLFTLIINSTLLSELTYKIPNVNFNVIFILIKGDITITHSEFLKLSQNHISKYLLEIFLYFTILYTFAYFIGKKTHQIIRDNGLDWRSKFWRFDNDWYYFLTGEKIFFQEEEDRYNSLKELYDDDTKDIEFAGTIVTTLVTFGNKTFLYKGFVNDFYFDKDGNLSKLVLVGAQRRTIESLDKNCQDETQVESKEDKHPYQQIEGDYFTVFASDMHTFNFIYLFEDTKTKIIYNTSGIEQFPISNKKQ